MLKAREVLRIPENPSQSFKTSLFSIPSQSYPQFQPGLGFARLEIFKTP
jgi:hypothetical protein